jgi:ribosomal protein L11 methyltransferase
VSSVAERKTDDVIEVVVSMPNILEDNATAAVLEAGLGDAGFEIRDQGSFKRAEPGRVELVFFTPVAEAPALVARVEQALAPIGKHVGVTTRRVLDSEWRDKWKEYFKVVYVTSRIVIVPSWEKHEATTAEIVLHLDPGRAFGTGQHESTRLVLRGLDAIEQRGHQPRRVLDVGCGSGILTVAALKLWPESRAVMCDIDPESVRVALENLELNGLSERVRGESRELAKIPGKFDLILANIQLDVLASLMPELLARLDQGGVLIVSGLLGGQDALLEPFIAHGPGKLAVWGRGTEGDWCAMVLYRYR